MSILIPYVHHFSSPLSVATPVSSLTELNKITPTSHPHGVIIWFQARSDDDRIWEQTIAPLFGIWHTQPNIRGMKDGMSYHAFVMDHAISHVLSCDCVCVLCTDVMYIFS